MTRTEKLLLLLLLGLHAAAVAYQVRAVGLTVDEPSHMVSAYLYWLGDDHLKPGDMPPFIKILGGWPSLLLTPPLPRGTPTWDTGHEWSISAGMINAMGPASIHRWIAWSRAPFILIGPLVTLLLWLWARRLWGPYAALFCAALWVLEPTALGHAALFKNDLSATLGYLAFWYAAWRFWQAPNWPRVLWLTLALVLVLCTKLSMLVLLPIAPLLLAARPLIDRRWRDAALWPAAALLLTYALCSAACHFEMRHLLYGETLILHLPAAARALPLPARFLDGTFSLLAEDRGLNLTYLFGEVRPGGHRLYFLAAMALKSPIPLLLLLLSSLALAARRRGFSSRAPAAFFLLFPPLYYIGLASLSSLQLGYRLVLPAVPFLILICGLAFERALQLRWHWIPAAAFLWTAVSVLSQYPYTISYFNAFAPGIHSRRHALSDSNLDWGHGLPALRRWCLENRVSRIRLSYFGNDPPFRHFPDNENMVELVAPPWNDGLAQGLELHPSPGIWAISATLLSGQLFEPKYRDYYRSFAQRPPDAVVAGSILIYRIPD